MQNKEKYALAHKSNQSYTKQGKHTLPHKPNQSYAKQRKKYAFPHKSDHRNAQPRLPSLRSESRLTHAHALHQLEAILARVGLHCVPRLRAGQAVLVSDSAR